MAAISSPPPTIAAITPRRRAGCVLPELSPELFVLAGAVVAKGTRPADLHTDSQSAWALATDGTGAQGPQHRIRRGGTMMALFRACVGTIAVLAARVAWSCPICHTAVGDQVRAGLFDPHLFRNVSATLLPFPVFALIIATIHFGFPRQQRDTTKASGVPSDPHPTGNSA